MLSPFALQAMLSPEIGTAMVFWFGSVALYGPAGKPIKHSRIRDMSRVIEVLNKGCECLECWPHAFICALDGHRRLPDTPGSAQLLAEAFPRLTKLMERLQPEWRTQIGGAIGEYVLRSHATPYPIWARNKFLGVSMPSLQAALTHTGTSFKHLARALSSMPDACSGETPTKAGRARRILDLERIASHVAERRRSVGEQRASAIVGLARKRIADLAHSGHLHRNSRGHFDAKEIEEFRARFVGIGTPVDALSKGHRTLRQIFRLHVPLTKTWDFLSDLLDGAIPSARKRDAAGHELPYVDLGHTYEWATKKIEDAELVTITTAATVLGLNKGQVFDLLRQGFFSSVINREATGLTRRIPMSELRRFQADFEQLAPLAERHGVARTIAYAWAIEVGLEVVSGPKIDGCGNYYIRRRDKYPFEP
jgi:hypothetical protein